MSKATPGPWRVIIDDTGGPFTGWPSVEAPEDVDTAIVHRAGFHQEHWGDLSMRECVANARLIAAAPDLLEALKKALNFIGNTEGELGITLDSGDAARAAIAKAEGRDP